MAAHTSPRPHNPALARYMHNMTVSKYVEDTDDR
jgi:hypothetical protein